jgi:hypothetical protein
MHAPYTNITIQQSDDGPVMWRVLSYHDDVFPCYEIYRCEMGKYEAAGPWTEVGCGIGVMTLDEAIERCKDEEEKIVKPMFTKPLEGTMLVEADYKEFPELKAPPLCQSMDAEQDAIEKGETMDYAHDKNPIEWGDENR